MIRLATSPEPHAARTESSKLTMLKTKNMADEAHRNIPAPEPNPEPNPQPNAAIAAWSSSITPADWDALFIAVTEQLQASITPVPPEPSTHHPLGVAGSLEETVQECVVSLKRLYATLLRDR